MFESRYFAIKYILCFNELISKIVFHILQASLFLL